MNITHKRIDNNSKIGQNITYMNRGKLVAKVLAIVLVVSFLMPQAVWAQLTSPNYKAEETFFGTGGELDASSPSYKAKQSAGELGSGPAASTNYKTQGGFNTNREEYIEFIVNSSSVDLGYLSSSTTASVTNTFSVKAYLSSGYVVRSASAPPSNGSHTLNNLVTPSASSAGTEQFGINLVANTSPSVGAAPVQVPDSTFSFGTAASGYNTPNLFKYVNGDIIAQSTQSSGTTQYTISYIYNIAGTTPDGSYSFHHVLVATATY
jgi:hypothetical protein